MRAVVMPAAITLLLLALIVGTVLHFSTSRSDELAVARQNRLVNIAIRQSMTAIANDQEASTYWDDAVLRTRERPLDLEWIDNNLGIWFHTYYRHDETYLLDAQNSPIYAMQDGARAQPGTFRRIANPALSLVGELRQKLELGRVTPEGSAGQTVGITEIRSIAGRPAIISIKPIISETGDIPQQPRSEYVHISVRYLDGNFVAPLESVYGIDGARFEKASTGAASFAVRTSDKKLLGYINWHPFRPGDQVERRMAPVLVAALLLVALLVCGLLVRIWLSRTELEASRAHAEHLAFHDSLTGLPNRALFEDRLEHELKRREGKLAVLMLDLDRFKNVNDTLGHQAGDDLIRQFGLRLTTLVRGGDTISRLGGDEFALLIENASLSDVRQLAERIREEIKRPFELMGSQAYVGVSIGIALASRSDTDRAEMVRRADIALYRAKEAGRNGYRVFSPDMDATVQLRGTIEEELRYALASGKGLCVHYQPQVAADGTIVGLEALVRWDHPTRGLIAPEKFVPIAEDTGLIIPLGEWVIRQACEASRIWPELFIAINLSPIQFRSKDFHSSLMDAIRMTGADPRALQLEVTERVLLDDDDSTREVMTKLRDAGFRIVLDDFGTGYSSLSYLRKFEVDKIKIDRSFIQHLGDGSDSAAIVSAILGLGRAMGLEVAAEGVETEAQRAFLAIAGCREMQGYHFSRPVTRDELMSLLDGGKRLVAAS